MKVVAIGDLHIVHSNSNGKTVFNKFIECEDVRNSDVVVFLGDVFDLMIGSHDIYLDKFDFFFEALRSLLQDGKEVYFIVGNHDFHLEKLFNRFICNEGLTHSLFHYSPSPFTLTDGRTTYFGHGDELELYNWKYQLYSTVIRSNLFKIIINSISERFIDWIGSRSSRASRKSGARKIKLAGERERALRFVETCTRFLELSKFDNLICGHSHFEADEVINGKHYINPGHSSRSQKFAIIEDGKARMATLQ
ncbi:MAG: metallophosphoesterase [Bacteriovoracaceae bacterium]|nr:metallophosphoesterase [Bacteriovoracaceae bacterium]